MEIEVHDVVVVVAAAEGPTEVQGARNKAVTDDLTAVQSARNNSAVAAAADGPTEVQDVRNNSAVVVAGRYLERCLGSRTTDISLRPNFDTWYHHRGVPLNSCGYVLNSPSSAQWVLGHLVPIVVPVIAES